MKTKVLTAAQKAWVTRRENQKINENLSPAKKAWVTRRKNEKKGVTSKVSVTTYDHTQNRETKREFKDFFVNCITKIPNTPKNPNLMVGLSHLWQTELKIIFETNLNNLNFITYEFRGVKNPITGEYVENKKQLNDFKKEQKKQLNQYIQLKERVKSLRYEPFKKMSETAVENNYTVVDADYCGNLSTFTPEIESMLTKKIVIVGGLICLTFKKCERSRGGVDARVDMDNLLKKYPNFKKVKLVGLPNVKNNYLNYSDGNFENGGMVGVIIKRIK